MLINVVEVGTAGGGVAALAFSEWETVERARALGDRFGEAEGAPSVEQCHVWYGGADVRTLRVEARLVDNAGRVEVGYVGGRLSSDDVLCRHVHAATMREAKDALIAYVIQRAKLAHESTPCPRDGAPLATM